MLFLSSWAFLFFFTLPLCLVYLESWSRIEALYNLSIVKETICSVSDGDHATAAAVNIDAVHVSERQADVCG